LRRERSRASDRQRLEEELRAARVLADEQPIREHDRDQEAEQHAETRKADEAPAESAFRLHEQREQHERRDESRHAEHGAVLGELLAQQRGAHAAALSAASVRANARKISCRESGSTVTASLCSSASQSSGSIACHTS